MRRFRIQGKTHINEWRIWIERDEVHVEHGVVDGRFQHTFDRPGDSGKIGTKSYIDPVANAAITAERQIRLKTEQGYREVDKDGESIGEELKMTFDKLPKALSFWKPRLAPTSKKEIRKFKLVTTHEPIITIKRDGFMHPVLIDSNGNPRIYTRRMDECTDKYPKLVQGFADMNIPRETILMCEFAVSGPDDQGDNRLTMQAISNSKPKRAQKLQEKNIVEAIVLSIPFFKGVSTERMNFGDILELMFFNIIDTGMIYKVEEFYGNFEEAKEHVRYNNLEGLVIYDPDALPGEKSYNLRGKPERPEGCWKWKALKEDDFIVIFSPNNKDLALKELGSFGKGKLKYVAGTVALYQRSGKTGELVFVSNCGSGSGLTETQRESIVQLSKGNHIIGVAEIRYAGRRYKSRGQSSNSLVEPIFRRWTDKTPDECINDEL